MHTTNYDELDEVPDAVASVTPAPNAAHLASTQYPPYPSGS
jgi:hypothetical protein